ncbi:MAG: NmrA/HSCARG family protein [Acidiferrobacterales bacterium]
MDTKLTVLVSGATGNQGGAVSRSLIAGGHQVRALTRNTDSPKTKALTALGVDVRQGNFDDEDAVANALKGVDSFYLMGSPLEIGVEGETAQGIKLANAARTAGVGHLVYGSVANADLDTGIPHFDSKYKVEQHIKTLDIPYTITAPAFFMDNVIAPWSIDALVAGKIMQAMPGDRVLQEVSVKNIGDFVASIIGRRDSVFGKRFDYAGDELTGNESAAILTQATGHPIQYESFPVSVLKEQSEDMAAMFDWFDRVGYSIDIKTLHRDFSDINWQNYRDWVDSQNWQFLEPKAVGHN